MARDARIKLAPTWRPTVGQLAELELGDDGLVYSGAHVVGRWDLVEAEYSERVS